MYLLLCTFQKKDISSPAQLRQGKYEPLTQHLSDADEQVINFTFSEIESILGFSLPPSAYKHTPWWGNSPKNSQAKGWLNAGYQAREVDILHKTVTFWEKQQKDMGERTMLDWNNNGKIDPVDAGISIAVQSTMPDEEEMNILTNEAKEERPNFFKRFLTIIRKPSSSAQPDGSTPKSNAPMKVALISCTKEKLPYRCKARELYSPSTLFSLSYQYAKQHADKIYILSAKYGLLAEDTIAEPYDLTLKNMSKEEKIQWTNKVFAQLKTNCNVNEDEFIILAGKSYYEYLLPMLPSATLPLGNLPMGKRMAYLKDLIDHDGRTASVHIEKPMATEFAAPKETSYQTEHGLQLHQLFCALPRYTWQNIASIPFQNGIYLVFEQGETYHGLPRIVRVGTHTSPNRLKQRLNDHFNRENHNGSIFRKNIGKAILNKANDPYLSTWTLDTSKPPYLGRENKAKETEVEQAVTSYLHRNITFTVFPIDAKEERLRLEKAIISSLHHTSDFRASDAWLGNYSPESAIRQSGMWLKQGVDAIPLTDAEMHTITKIVASLSTQSILTRSPFISASEETQSIPLSVGDRINHRGFGDGVVVKMTPMAGDVLMEINFANVGTKRLMLRAASRLITKLS